MTDQKDHQIPEAESPPESDDLSNNWSLELSDYLAIDDDTQWLDDESFVSQHNLYHQNYVFHHQQPIQVEGATSNFESSSSTNISSGHEKKEAKHRYAFKTKSEVEVLDDGYKWRKYGKKMVKNSPNPRNYYRCSVDGCSVKKRVERDRDDPMYVITTYEGIHIHHPSSSRY
ncbi:probable WRKY transcription factor 50 [Arachis stenosperma]|uniref:probable WRKY transcription factor 50 n=1 Tax=Arachis stenosperma TaxID=217475 RepID=UPI0025AD1D6B|nr:probable WRKY transcription factor 50 [Arachis stenosperma]